MLGCKFPRALTVSQKREWLVQLKETKRFHEEALENEQAGKGSPQQGKYRVDTIQYSWV